MAKYAKNFMGKRKNRNPYAHLSKSRMKAIDGDDNSDDLDDRPAEGSDGDEKDEPDLSDTGDDDAKPLNASDGDDTSEEAEMDEEDEKADEDDDQKLVGADDDEKEDRLDAMSRERNRCKAIFRRKEAAINPSMAAHLAFETNLSRTEAVRLLENSVQGMSRSQKRSAKHGTFGTGAFYQKMRTQGVRPVTPNKNNQNGAMGKAERLLAAAKRIGKA